MRASNPTRRNRNIGTSKSGHGQDNRMTVPKVAHGRNEFWERIQKSQRVSRTIAGRAIDFYVQPTRKDCVHPCSVDDVVRMFECIPSRDWNGIEAVAFRQPRRKEETLAPVWGRLAYAADFVNERGGVLYRGPAIVLEAIDLSKCIEWGNGLSNDHGEELAQLKSDGHEITVTKRSFRLKPSPESCRATQLYRTLLHEVGHWVDFTEKVEKPYSLICNDDELEKYSHLLDKFHSRPSREKEKFAHAYAVRTGKHLRSAGLIPFD